MYGERIWKSGDRASNWCTFTSMMIEDKCKSSSQAILEVAALGLKQGGLSLQWLLLKAKSLKKRLLDSRVWTQWLWCMGLDGPWRGNLPPVQGLNPVPCTVDFTTVLPGKSLHFVFVFFSLSNSFMKLFNIDKQPTSLFFCIYIFYYNKFYLCTVWARK